MHADGADAEHALLRRAVRRGEYTVGELGVHKNTRMRALVLLSIHIESNSGSWNHVMTYVSTGNCIARSDGFEANPGGARSLLLSPRSAR